MKIGRIEEVLYLVRINLFDYDTDLGNWTEAEVVQIVNGNVTLRHEDGRERTWSLDELEALCHKLHDEHFSWLFNKEW